MKKKLFLTLCCFMGVLCVNAQSKMTPEELKFRNGIEKFLKEEGYLPTIDDSDNSVNFKKEGTLHWISVSCSDDPPVYIRFHRSGFSLDDTNRSIMLEACNYANKEKKCGKACMNDDSVLITVEFYCYTIEAFKNAFKDNLKALSVTKEAVSDYYNEHTKR